METYYRVKSTIEKRGYKVSKLEKILGFKNRCISRWEKCEPRLNNIVRLAQFLDVSLDYLAGLTDSPKGQYGDELTPDEVEIISLLRNPIFSDEDRDYVKFNLKLFFEYKSKISIARDEE